MVEGAAYLFRGTGFFLRHPRLWRYVIYPLIINTLIFAALVVAAILFLPDLLDRILPDPEGLKQFLYWPLLVLAWLLIALAFVIAFYFSATLLSAPFYTRLAQQTLGLLRGRAPEMPGGFRADFVVPVLNTIRRLALLLALLPLSLIPVVGVAVAPVITAFFFALEFLDYPIETVSPPQPFSARRRYAWRHRWVSLGFGGIVTVGMMVPLIDLAVMPMAVVGATLWFHERPLTPAAAPAPDEPRPGE